MSRRRWSPEPARALLWGVAGAVAMRLSLVVFDEPWTLFAFGTAGVVSIVGMVRALTRRA